MDLNVPIFSTPPPPPLLKLQRSKIVRCPSQITLKSLSLILRFRSPYGRSRKLCGQRGTWRHTLIGLQTIPYFSPSPPPAFHCPSRYQLCVLNSKISLPLWKKQKIMFPEGNMATNRNRALIFPFHPPPPPPNPLSIVHSGAAI